MSFQPKDSPIKHTKADDDHINSLHSVEEISAYMRNLAEDQKLVYRPDPVFAPDLLADMPAGTAPKKIVRPVVIQGQKFFLEGADEAELDRREAEARKVAENQSTTTQDDQPPRDANGRFVKNAPADAAEQQRTVDKVELELQFKRGEIDTATFLERSGAIQDALDKMGVSEIIQERQGQKEVQSWSEATEKFLNSAGGANWPGTEANKTTLGQIIQTFQTEDGTLLADLQDKQEAITIAWNYMQEHPELIKENPELVQRDKISKATSRSEIDEILGRNARLQSQQIWGSR